MVLDHEADHPSRGAAVTSIAEKIGCSAHTLLELVKKAEVDSGKRAGVPTELADRRKTVTSPQCFQLVQPACLRLLPTLPSARNSSKINFLRP